MSYKRVAVLSENTGRTLTWLHNEHKKDVYQVRYATGVIELQDGTTFHIITNKEQARGCTFNDYIKDPTYESLEDAIKTRIFQEPTR